MQQNICVLTELIELIERQRIIFERNSPKENNLIHFSLVFFWLKNFQVPFDFVMQNNFNFLAIFFFLLVSYSLLHMMT